MLPSFVVRIGFLTHLLWDRYGPFWVSLARAAGAEVVFAEPDEVLARLTDPRTAAPPAIAFRLAVAAALALEDVDLLVVPRLNPETDGGPGSGQDPWIADLPATLGRTVGGGPTLWPVDAHLAGSLETPAVTFLARIARDAGSVRRVWSQHRAAARPPRRVPPSLTVRPSDLRTVAVLGQPWTATPALTRLATRPAEHGVGPYGFEPADLRAEGWRVEPRWIDTDAEALGAVRRFARAAATVQTLRLVIDAASGSDAWLQRRAEALAPRRLEVVDLRDVGDDERRLRALLDPNT